VCLLFNVFFFISEVFLAASAHDAAKIREAPSEATQVQKVQTVIDVRGVKVAEPVVEVRVHEVVNKIVEMPFKNRVRRSEKPPEAQPVQNVIDVSAVEVVEQVVEVHVHGVVNLILAGQGFLLSKWKWSTRSSRCHSKTL